MGAFWRTYEWLEIRLWNSLTRKLMSFLLLFLLDFAYIVIYLRIGASLRNDVGKHIPPDTLATLEADLDQGLYLMLGLTALAMIWSVLQILYLRHLIVRPIQVITDVFDEIARGEGDFSRNLPTVTHDELRSLAEAYNRFADKMRQIISEVREMTVNIAREAVVVQKRVQDTAQGAERQGTMTETVFTASNEATLAIQEVSHSAELISHATSSNLEQARASLGELGEIVHKVHGVSEKLNRFSFTVSQLSERSDSIRQIASLIKDIADQTNLLALNAAIEAARAGEAGRGFAVVADEVRGLADRVNKATQEISINVDGMITLVKDTQRENQVINTDIGATQDVVERSSGLFHAMVSDFERTSDQLLQITAAMEELGATNSQVHDSVTQIHRLSADVSRHMEASATSTISLTKATESVQELVSRFKIGRGTFDFNVEAARKFRDAVQERLEGMRDRGLNVFDRDYRPIPDTSPQKYRVSYDEAYIRECQQILDDALKTIKGGIYAVAVDVNGYLSGHNSKYSRPLTGDYQSDLIGNRTRRKFEAPMELRAARNTSPVLFQTFIRDTGELLCDIIMPIHVAGQLWGNVRVGCDSAVLLDKR
ncbi:MAG: methyl-accepting chemotaxis protein [Rhodocyclaceae bacterium]|nr:methyl-accepting chemotaxis protein [Rhodocyclaceae bacterium]